MRLMLATHGRLSSKVTSAGARGPLGGRQAGPLQIPRLQGVDAGPRRLWPCRPCGRRARQALRPPHHRLRPVHRRDGDDRAGVEPVSLPELLARADMHSPAAASAQRMIREEHFRQMKKTAIHQQCGTRADHRRSADQGVDEGLIASAGLDAFEKEPPGGNNPLLRMDKVILTRMSPRRPRADPARRAASASNCRWRSPASGRCPASTHRCIERPQTLFRWSAAPIPRPQKEPSSAGLTRGSTSGATKI